MLAIGNLIGRALKVDLNTLAQKESDKFVVERGKFARVSVEVDLNKPLQSKFSFRNRIYTVEYEGLEIICFKCGIYGHTQETCHQKQLDQMIISMQTEGSPENRSPTVSNEKEERTVPLMSIPGVSAEEDYGEWMKVKSRSRQRIQRADSDRKNSLQTAANVRMNRRVEERGEGSRFQILQISESEALTKEREGLNLKKTMGKQWKKKEVAVDTSEKKKSQSDQTSDKAGPSGMKDEGKQTAQTAMGAGKSQKKEKAMKQPNKLEETGSVGPIEVGMVENKHIGHDMKVQDSQNVQTINSQSSDNGPKENTAGPLKAMVEAEKKGLFWA